MTTIKRVLAGLLCCALCLGLWMPTLAEEDSTWMQRFTKKGAMALPEEKIAGLTTLFRLFGKLRLQKGALDQWSGQDKLQLAKAMRAQGVFPKVQEKELADTKAGERKADSLLKDYFGQNPAEPYILMENELGNPVYWPYTLRALRTEMEQALGTAHREYRYHLPSRQDVGYEQAVRLAYETLAQKFAFFAEETKGYTVDAAFVENTMYSEDVAWLIHFRNPDTYSYSYDAVVSRGGEVQSIAAPGQEMQPVKQGLLTGVAEVAPAAHDVERAQAVAEGTRFLQQMGFGDKERAGLVAKAYFVRGEGYADGREPVWLIGYYDAEDSLRFKALVGYDGTPIDAVRGEQLFTQTRRFDMYNDIQLVGLEAAYGRDKLRDFYDWSIEEKAAYSRDWQARILAYIASKPYFIKTGSCFLYDSTLYTYGLPGAEDITEEKATYYAIQAIIGLGADARYVEERRITSYFDISHTEKPLWKFTFSTAAVPLDNISDTAYRVLVDARTGDIVEAYAITSERSGPESFY